MTIMMMMMMTIMMMTTDDDDDGGDDDDAGDDDRDCVFVMRIGGRVSALTPRFLYYSPHAVSAVMSLDFSCAVFSCQSFCTFDIYNATVDILVIDTVAIASR